MAKTNRPDELASYLSFQRAVADGLAKAARLDAKPESAFIPYGRCSHHPSVSTFEHGFDVPCYRCEAEMEEDLPMNLETTVWACKTCGRCGKEERCSCGGSRGQIATRYALQLYMNAYEPQSGWYNEDDLRRVWSADNDEARS